MKKLCALLAFMVPAFVAQAATPTVDFSTLSATGSDDLAASSVTLGGVTATAYVFNAAAWRLSDLWARNQSPNEHGLGVCSFADGPNCTLGGDYNEVDNSGKIEGIALTKAGSVGPWSDIFVSSLDTGGSNDNESGFLVWSDSPLGVGTMPNPAGPPLSNWLSFSHSQLGANEGSIWGLLSASQQAEVAAADYLFFMPNMKNGTNNDFLVWGVSAIPEPETYAMLLAGLGLLGFIARRRSRKLDA